MEIEMWQALDPISVFGRLNFDSLFIDDTYISKRIKTIEFPSRDEALQRAVEWIESQVGRKAESSKCAKPSINILIPVYKIGKEWILTKLAQHFNTRVRVESKERFSFLRAIGVGEYFVPSSDKTAWIHAIGCTSGDHIDLLHNSGCRVLVLSGRKCFSRQDDIYNKPSLCAVKHILYSDHCSPAELALFIRAFTYGGIYALNGKPLGKVAHDMLAQRSIDTSSVEQISRISLAISLVEVKGFELTLRLAQPQAVSLA